MEYRENILSGESNILEYKEEIPEDNKKWLKTVVAFANGKGGKIIFGIKDGTFEVKGIESDNIFKVMDGISNAVSESCSPQIMSDVYLKEIEEKTVIVLEVSSGNHTPYYIKKEGIQSGVYVRIGATTRQADEETIRTLLFEGSNKSYDQQIIKAKKLTEEEINSLSETLYQVALKNTFSTEENSQIKKVGKTQLISWGIIAEKNNEFFSTNAYELLRDNDIWNSKIQCAVFKGRTRAVFVDRREYSGPLFEQIEEAYQFVLRNIKLGAKIEGLYRNDAYELPPAAIRELIVNAVVHRNYIENSCIQVAIYDDRLEVTSPGGFPKGVTIDRVKSGFSKVRNEALANAFFYIKLIEHWGSGIPRIIQQTAEAELPELQIEETESYVRFNLYRSLNRSNSEYTEDFSNEIGLKEKNTEEDVEKFGLNSEDYTETEYRILKEIAAHPTVTNEELSKIIGITKRAVEMQMKKLREKNLIERIGSKKTGFYQIVRKEEK